MLTKLSEMVIYQLYEKKNSGKTFPPFAHLLIL